MIIVIVTMNVFLDKQTEVMQTLLSMIELSSLFVVQAFELRSYSLMHNITHNFTKIL